MEQLEKFHPLKIEGNSYFIEYKKKYIPSDPLNWDTVQVSFDFAYNMTFGERGEHRDHRSGGTYNRKSGEIFKDTFQGKLAECALRNALQGKYKITLPSFDVWGLGKWDTEDFLIDKCWASVKSTKSYGNLLLLETKDFGNDGSYLPNLESGNGIYDYFILVRMDPFCEEIMKKNKILYSESVPYNEIKDIIISQKWTYDVPGYITKEDIQEVIKYRHIIPRGAMLNGKTKIDASNYYVQAGDLRPITEL